MQIIIRKDEEEKKKKKKMVLMDDETKPLWQTVLYFAAMIGILVFANWGQPQTSTGLWSTIYHAKWTITALFGGMLAVILIAWFHVAWWKVVVTALAVLILALIFPEQPMMAFIAGTIGLSAFTSTAKDETQEWFCASWEFAKQILPLLLIGVLVAGFLLGRVGHEGMIPSEWIARAVGGNSLFANFFASFAGAFMYFATLTEVPILQGLISNGMGKGPALALLLAGPALSLPSMLVIKSVIGFKKTMVFVALVITMATISGMIFGTFFA